MPQMKAVKNFDVKMPEVFKHTAGGQPQGWSGLPYKGK